ncbi:unnamed protein product [Paramecium primaurelia]|uniref:EF-hand domain-containing protein n=1 Tax=Paramecium primaurelia TaxID=5886 RepID=A0A8S1LPB4_PARPR|nr:unnamed protein product [Paramecium primaurelia]
MSALKAIVTLDTGDKPEYIHIYEGDDIEMLAEFFCDRHNIQEDGKQFIIDHIKDQLKLQEKQIKQKFVPQTNSLKQCQSQAIIYKPAQVKKNDYEELHNTVWAQIQKKPSTTQLHQRNTSNFITQGQKSQGNLLLKKNELKNTKCITDIEQNKDCKQQPKRSRQEQIDFANRLISQKNVSEKRLQKLRIESNSPISHDFRPKVTKDNIYKKVSKKIDQEDYELAQMIGIPQRKKIFEFAQQKIKYKQDQDILKRIFNQLDNDKDGQISTNFINLDIDHQILEKIKPVLCHMEAQHLILDFDSFSNLMKSFQILIY